MCQVRLNVGSSFRALMLQAATLDVASSNPATTGTYVGCVWSEYMVLQETCGVQPNVAALTGNGLTFLAGRVSYTFGLQGKLLCVGTEA